MLFRKKHPRSCSYCVYGTKLNNEEVLCVKKGIMSADKKCCKFKYDPFKRIPLKAKPADFSKYDCDDFSL